MKPTTLHTERLRIRPVAPTDAEAIQAAASDRRIADTMISIPHPYPEGEAERYITAQQAERAQGRGATFVIMRASDEAF